MGEIHGSVLKIPKKGKHDVAATDESLKTDTKETLKSKSNSTSKTMSKSSDSLKRSKTQDVKKEHNRDTSPLLKPRGRQSFSRSRDTMFQFTVFD